MLRLAVTRNAGALLRRTAPTRLRLLSTPAEAMEAKLRDELDAGHRAVARHLDDFLALEVVEACAREPELVVLVTIVAFAASLACRATRRPAAVLDGGQRL